MLNFIILFCLWDASSSSKFASEEIEAWLEVSIYFKYLPLSVAKHSHDYRRGM